MENIRYPIAQLLGGFEWFDEGLQRSLLRRGWPVLTRPESIIMIHVLLGIRRPSDLARRLSLTRQAIHVTLAKIVEKGLFLLEPDPSDKRMVAVSLTPMGQAMINDANRIVDCLTITLAERLGPALFQALIVGLNADWGEVVSVEPWEIEETKHLSAGA